MNSGGIFYCTYLKLKFTEQTDSAAENLSTASVTLITEFMV